MFIVCCQNAKTAVPNPSDYGRRHQLGASFVVRSLPAWEECKNCGLFRQSMRCLLTFWEAADVGICGDPTPAISACPSMCARLVIHTPSECTVAVLSC